MLFPVFKGDSLPSKGLLNKRSALHSKERAIKRNKRVELFSSFTKEDFNNWCKANSIHQTTIKYEDYFLEWRKASTNKDLLAKANGTSQM